ncbi:hypothetical protein FRB99_006630 [Tulasnella sp. 403]|nr:hypothetical protein FRB99_006630 [Tulasnella sp. 403]
MDSTLPSTSSMAASYENDQPLPVQDPMDMTIAETVDKLNNLKAEVGEVSNRIAYLRDIRPHALKLLAQADAAEEEANRLEAEKNTLDKEVDRIKSVVARMEDMRYSTKQLTDQMQLDTALQMRHILENGKSIVPRHPPNARIKRSISDDSASDASSQHGPLFKIPRRDVGTDAISPSVHGPAPNAALPRPGSANSSGAAGAATSKFSPSRNVSITPTSSMANIAAALAAEGAASVARSTLAAQQQPFIDVPPVPTGTPTSVTTATATVSMPPTVMSPPLPYSFSTTTAVTTVMPTGLPTAAAYATSPTTFPSTAMPNTFVTAPTSSTTISLLPASTSMALGASGGGGAGMYAPASANSLATALGQKVELENEYGGPGGDEADDNGKGREFLYR